MEIKLQAPNSALRSHVVRHALQSYPVVGNILTKTYLMNAHLHVFVLNLID